MLQNYTIQSNTHQIALANYAVQTNTHRCFTITLYKAIHIRFLWPITLYTQIPAYGTITIVTVTKLTLQEVCFTKGRTENLDADKGLHIIPTRDDPKCHGRVKQKGKGKKIHMLPRT